MRTQGHLDRLARLLLPVYEGDPLEQPPVHALLQLLQQQVRAGLSNTHQVSNMGPTVIVLGNSMRWQLMGLQKLSWGRICTWHPSIHAGWTKDRSQAPDIVTKEAAACLDEAVLVLQQAGAQLLEVAVLHCLPPTGQCQKTNPNSCKATFAAN